MFNNFTGHNSIIWLSNLITVSLNRGAEVVESCQAVIIVCMDLDMERSIKHSLVGSD